MANEQNLIPNYHTLTLEDQKKGGQASVIARKERKLIKERILEKMGEDDWDTMILNAIQRAKEDDKAFITLRDTIGEKPVDRVEQTTIEAPMPRLAKKKEEE